MKTIKEGMAEVLVPKESDVLISKDMDVFYNPKMKLNRDMTILLLNSIKNTQMKMADIMAGTGVRAVRLLKELKKDKLKEITINDYDQTSVELIRKNLLNNNLEIDERIVLENKEASILLLQSSGFDYIDIDPFGSPNPFLDSAIKKLSRSGILAVTATDTAALSGSTVNAGIRKYGAVPSNNFLMHETGVRILARKVQLIGAQYDKALVPIFSYAKDHYYRIFFWNDKGKKRVDELLKDQKYILVCDECLDFKVSEKNFGICKCNGGEMSFIGPMFAGSLFDGKLIKDMKNSIDVDDKAHKELLKLLVLADEEAKIDRVGFFDLHELCESLKISVPKFESVMAALKEKGFSVARTLFSEHSIKTDATHQVVVEILKRVK